MSDKPALEVTYRWWDVKKEHPGVMFHHQGETWYFHPSLDEVQSPYTYAHDPLFRGQGCPIVSIERALRDKFVELRSEYYSVRKEIPEEFIEYIRMYSVNT